MRTIDAKIIEVLQNGGKLNWAFELLFDTPYRIFAGDRNVTIDGNEFIQSSDFLKVTSFAESIQNTEQQVQVFLDGTANIADRIIDSSYKDRTATIYLVVILSNGEEISYPIYSGFADSDQIMYSPDSVKIELTLRSFQSDLVRNRTWFCTSEDQAILHRGQADTFFALVPEIPNIRLDWIE